MIEKFDDDMGIVRPDVNFYDDDKDTSLRPKLLKDFLGQTKVKNNLHVFIEAAKSRQEPMDHLFLIGPPGLGKTTLAQITAQELGADFKVTSAPALEKPKDLAGILSTITEGTVFFIDEIHRLKPAIEEMLYIAMEDYELDWIIGQGAAARTVRIPIPKFTLVGATTRAGDISAPLRDRFGITSKLSYYTDEELYQIICRTSKVLGMPIVDDAAKELARRSRKTPRIANRLFKRVRDFALVFEQDEIDDEITKTSLKRLKVDEDGLDQVDIQYLDALITKFNGGPVGAQTVATSIGEEVTTIEDVVEPYLLQEGFVKRTPRGRVATEKAYKHLNIEYDPNSSNK